eukprot:TRINITY_DN90265_c0_g1_i1.p1 TRINITY_DN90265_c0_g1~~TRINITY_DN90265_c0_g1_i1.p1  ORF type:complete len:656 (-),score=160.32 TRINITY_DN90265_c0_g1_i1:105-2072(-)
MWPCKWVLLVASALLRTPCPVAATGCSDAASCGEALAALTGRLDSTQEAFRQQRRSVKELEDLRVGLFSGARLELPSAKREHLERGADLVQEISFDARHKPLSTNMSHHFTGLRTIASHQQILFQELMPLKRPSSSSNAHAAVIVTVDSDQMMSLFTLQGDTVLELYDLGHGPNRTITHFAVSPAEDSHFVASADDTGLVRVHDIRVIVRLERRRRRGSKYAEDDEDDDAPGGRSASCDADAANGTCDAAGKEERRGADGQDEKKPEPDADGAEAEDSDPPVSARRVPHSTQVLYASAAFATSFKLPRRSKDEERHLNTLIALDRGINDYFLAGDSLGGISVLFRNGTFKGRMRVTDDVGGVLGLKSTSGHGVAFWSSHSFGFFQVSGIDVQYPPCAGWSSPAVDMIVEPGSTQTRVILSLSDGDVLVYAITRGKSKACDLNFKFPRLTSLPLKLHFVRGHVMGLPLLVQAEETRRRISSRDMFFFNLAAMEDGYQAGPSKVLTVQASFSPRLPQGFLFLGSAPVPVPGVQGAKFQLALRFAGEPGLELVEVGLRPPPQTTKDVNAGGTSSVADDWVDAPEEAEKQNTWLAWLEYFNEGAPKMGVFGCAAVGIIGWNVRKGMGSGGGGGGGSGFDEAEFERILKKMQEEDNRKKG